jgi:hypothetical protein
VALPAREEAEAVDAAMGAPEEVRGSRIAGEVIARALLADGRTAFSSAEEVGLLDQAEFDALWSETLTALVAISPSYARSDVAAWRATLEEGAKHRSNLHDALVLGASADFGWGTTVYRPDRYWGLATCDLLDGHWMAFAAARKVSEEIMRRSR